MKLAANQIVAIAIAFLAAITVCVVTGKVPASVLLAASTGFVGWLTRSPFAAAFMTTTTTTAHVSPPDVAIPITVSESVTEPTKGTQ